MTQDDELTTNSRSVDSLVDVINSLVISLHNVLVLDREIGRLINYLTPFSRLKDLGKFDQTLWLDDQSIGQKVQSDHYKGVIVVVGGWNNKLPNKIDELITFIGSIRKRTYLIVENLTRSLLYELNDRLKGDVSFEAVINQQLLDGKPVRLTPFVRVLNWKVLPLEIDENVFSLEMDEYGGLESYFKQPLQQVSLLGDLFIDIMKILSATSHGNKMTKLKNVYALGDHASLLSQIIINDKIPDYLSSSLTSLEQQFYQDKVRGNTDLIILERNLDYLPVAFSQLNYQGLLDDLFGISYDSVPINLDINKNSNNNNNNNNASNNDSTDSVLLNDQLFKELKDFNFASIGAQLNQMARYIQGEYLKRDTLLAPGLETEADLSEVKKLVSNLGSLTNKQELIKKHTQILETILDKIKNDIAMDSYGDTNQYEQFLEFQNELFEHDYKTNLNKVKDFITRDMASNITISGLILISIVHDGIKERDFEALKLELVQNLGLLVKNILNTLVTYKVIKIVESVGATSEILGALASLSLVGNKQTAAGSEEENPDGFLGYDNIQTLGTTGGVLGNKALFHSSDKFFNLHPLDEDDWVKRKDGNTPSDTVYNLYQHPSFALPGSTVPLLVRLVELLYQRDSLVYKPVNNISRRPNWSGLELESTFHGKITDINLDDTLDSKKRRATPGTIIEETYVVVIILGGITRSEMSCFNYLQLKLNDKRQDKKKLMVLTSGVVNGTKLVNFAEKA